MKSPLEEIKNKMDATPLPQGHNVEMRVNVNSFFYAGYKIAGFQHLPPGDDLIAAVHSMWGNDYAAQWEDPQTVLIIKFGPLQVVPFERNVQTPATSG